MTLCYPKKVYSYEKDTVHYFNKGKGENMNHCEVCGTEEVKVRFEVGGDSMQLCMDCHNEMMAAELGIILEPIRKSFTLDDHSGVERLFTVERRIHYNGIFIEAMEDKEFGYRFAVHGELNTHQTSLMERLIEKTKKGISGKQVKTEYLPNGVGHHIVVNDQFDGVIEYDSESEHTPLILIDGNPYSWDEVGKMLMTYEGFAIKVKVYEMADDEEWEEGR